MHQEAPHREAAPRESTAYGRRHRYALFGVVSIALFMSSVDMTIVSTALPTIGRDLGSSGLNWTSWVITVYSLGRVVVTPLVGRVSELLGTRTIFILALGIFTVASLACGLAQSLPMLIVLRAVQAIGGSAFIPSATALVSDAFAENRDRAVGLFSSIIPIGAIVGPVLGGVLVNYWSWRWVFLINVPTGLIVALLAARLIPAVAPAPSERFDLIGSFMLCTALLSAALAITYLGDAAHGTGPVFWTLLAVAVVPAVILVRRSDLPGAVLPRRLLHGNGFGAMNLINLCYGATSLGISALVPVYAQARYDLSSLQAGTLLTARGVGMIAVTGAATFALRRTGYRWPMGVGFVLAAAGMVMLAFSPPGALSANLWLSIAALVVGLGMGIALPASNNASLQLDPDKIASIAGLRVTLRQLGAIAAVSVTTALMTHSVHPGITEAHVFLGFAAMMLGLLALLRMVPEHRSNW